MSIAAEFGGWGGGILKKYNIPEYPQHNTRAPFSMQQLK